MSSTRPGRAAGRAYCRAGLVVLTINNGQGLDPQLIG
jgi:hypothetical protein